MNQNLELALKIAAETTGREDLAELAATVASFGDETAEAAPEAERLATELNSLAATHERLQQEMQQAGADTQRLTDEQQQVKQAINQAAAEAEQLAERLRTAADETDQLAQATGQADGKLAGLGKRLAAGATAFTVWAGAAAAGAASLAVGMLTRYTASQAELATQLNNTSAALGVNAQTLQEYQYAFDKVGINADKTADILKDVADKIGDAWLNGGGEAIEAIETLNLSIEELVRLSPDQQLLAIADALNGLPKAGQVQVLEALADDASLLQPLLENNAAGLRRLAAEARSVGAIISPEQIADLIKTDEAINRLQGRLQGLRNRLLAELSPAVNQVADEFDAMLADNPGLVDDLATAFGGLMRTAADWALAMIEHREQIGTALQGLIDTAQFLGNAFLAAFRGVQTAAAGVLTVVGDAVAGVLEKIEWIAFGLRKVGLISQESLDTVSAHARAARATVDDLARQTLDYGQQALAAGKNAISAFDNTGQAAERAGQRQAAAQQQLANATVAAVDQAEQSAQRWTAVNQQLDQQFQQLIQRGGSVKEAFASLFGQADLGSENGVRRLIETLLSLAEQGVITADQLRDSLGAELTKLSNEDFAAFGVAAEAAFAKGSEGAALAATAIEQDMSRAFDTLGLDLAEVDTGIDSVMQHMIASFERIALHSESSADRIKAAFIAAINRADTEQELEAIRHIWAQTAEQSELSTQDMLQGLESLDRKVSAVRNNAAGLGGDFGEIEEQGSPAVQRLKSEVERLRAEIASLRGDMRGAAQEAGELDSAVRAATGGGSSRLKGPISVQTHASQLDYNRLRGDLGAIEKEILNVQAELDKELEYRRNSGRLPGGIADVLSDTRLGQIQRATDELQRLQQQAQQRQASQQPQRAPDPTVTRVPEANTGLQPIVLNLPGQPPTTVFAQPGDETAFIDTLANLARTTLTRR